MSNDNRQLDEEVSLTGNQILKKLRELVQPPGKKGTWLRHLSDPRLAEVYHRLRLGQTAGHVVRIAQRDWGVMRNSSAKSLTRAVQRFRDQVLNDIRLDSVKSPENKKPNIKKRERGLKIVQKLDGLGRLRWLIEVQTERVEAWLSKEKASMPFKMTDKTIKILGELIDTYMRYQVDLGLIDAKPTEHNINIHHKFGQILASGMITDDGARIMEAANRFMELAEEHAIIMTPGPDGCFAQQDALPAPDDVDFDDDGEDPDGEYDDT